MPDLTAERDAWRAVALTLAKMARRCEQGCVDGGDTRALAEARQRLIHMGAVERGPLKHPEVDPDWWT